MTPAALTRLAWSRAHARILARRPLATRKADAATDRTLSAARFCLWLIVFLALALTLFPAAVPGVGPHPSTAKRTT